jgi:serine/threonine protein kinase
LIVLVESPRYQMPPQTSTQECSIDEDEDYILGDGTELPFQIEKVLGQGSSAIVEKVRDTKTGYVFALKSMNFSRARDKPRAEEKFKREVSVIRCLRGHHHIIRLYATFAAKRRFGLILQPAAEEGNLEQYLGVYWDAVEEPAGSNLDIAEMTLVLEQAFGCLANGLAFMHANEIRHKDIKPQNILVHQGSVIYTDFGSAKDGKQCGSNTTEGPTEFTRRYAPPEVLEQGHRNFGADVYCLGCVFLEILAAVSQMISVDIDYRETQFIHMLDEVHDELAIVTMPPKLSCLPALIMSMTVRDRTKRPRADVVFANMTPDSGLFCEECSKTHREAKRLTPWTWSSAHGRHFCNMLGDKDDLLGRVWSEPANHSETSSSVPMTYHVADLRCVLTVLGR